MADGSKGSKAACQSIDCSSLSSISNACNDLGGEQKQKEKMTQEIWKWARENNTSDEATYALLDILKKIPLKKTKTSEKK